MKYYAVTDDPRELYHYGVKGMKWGQHLFGDDLKPKSQSYKRLASKLRASLKKTQQKHEQNAEIRSANRYNKQLQKALQRTQLSQKKYGWDQISNDMKANEKAFKNAQKAVRVEEKHNRRMEKANRSEYFSNIKNEERTARINAKQAHKAAKAEKRFDKYLQEAREGRIKMAKLSDEQVNRIQDRLAQEQNARRLGGTEKPTFKRRLKEATQEGLIQGTTRGIAAGIEEIARAKIQNKLRNKAVLDKKSENEAKRQKKAQQIKNQKSHKEIRKEIKEEAYEAQVREGVNPLARHNFTATGAAKHLQAVNASKNERQRVQNLNNRLADQRDESWNNYLNENNISEYDALKKITGSTSEKAFNKLSNEEKVQAIQKRLNQHNAAEKAGERLTDQLAYKEFEEHEAAVEKYKEDSNRYKAEKAQYDKDFKDYQQQLSGAIAKRAGDLQKAQADYDQRLKDYNDDQARIQQVRNQIGNGSISITPAIRNQLQSTVRHPGRRPTMSDIPMPIVRPKPIPPKEPTPPKSLSYNAYTRFGKSGGKSGGKKNNNKKN